MNHKQRLLNILIVFSLLLGWTQSAKAAPIGPNAIPSDGCGWFWRTARVDANGQGGKFSGQIVNNGNTDCTGIATLVISNTTIAVQVMFGPEGDLPEFKVEPGRSVSVVLEPVYNFPENTGFLASLTLCINGTCQSPVTRTVDDWRIRKGAPIWIKPEIKSILPKR